jgi:hypothetical protein
MDPCAGRPCPPAGDVGGQIQGLKPAMPQCPGDRESSPFWGDVDYRLVDYRRPLTDPLLLGHRAVGDDIATGGAVLVMDRLCSMNASVSAPSSATMNGTRCCIKPLM